MYDTLITSMRAQFYCSLVYILLTNIQHTIIPIRVRYILDTTIHIYIYIYIYIFQRNIPAYISFINF